MISALLGRLGVRASERRLVARLGFVHFVLIASYTLARAARDAVFLDALTARRLPYLYVGVALWTALISSVFGRLSSRQQLQRSLSQLLVVCGAALVVFGVVLRRYFGPVPAVGFYLWTGAYGLILISLFWVLVNEATDAREAKRLFGIVGAWGIVGGMAGGGLATLLGGLAGPESTLFVAGALLVAIAPLSRNIIDAGSSRVLVLPSLDVPPPDWRRDRYVMLLSALFLVGGLTASFVDYQFKVVVERLSAGNLKELTRLLGSYYAVLNAVAILLQLVASSWLLRRLGASTVAGLLPAGVAVGSLAALFKPALPMLLAATRMYEAGMRVSLAKTAWEFLFFPLSPALRRRVKTWIDAVVDRGAEALAGLAILALGAAHLDNPRFLGSITVVLALVWLFLSLRLRSAYVKQLSRSLRTLVLEDPEPESAPEALLIEEALRLLDSPFEKRALYAFELLERIDPAALDLRLGALQEHPSPTMRARALGRLADPVHPVASPLLATLAHDESAEVQTAAFRLYAARFADADEQMERLAASDDESARAAALTYLVSRPGSTDRDVLARVDTVLKTGTQAERQAVAMGLGRRPRPSDTHQRLVQFLADPAPEVRREALAACAAAGVRELVPLMLPLLGATPTRDAARAAIATFGNRIVGTLGDVLVDLAAPIGLRREIPPVLAAIGTQPAANELLRVPESLDPLFRHRLLQAQNRIRGHDASILFPRQAVRAALESDVEMLLRLHMHLDAWDDVEPSRARSLLHASLAERRDAAFTRIFRRLGLLYPAKEIHVAFGALTGQARRTRAQALEYLDAVLLPEDRRLVVPVLEEPERRAVLARSLYGIVAYTPESSLAELVRAHDAWLQACGLYVIGAKRFSALADLARTALGHETALVQETARWCLVRLETP